MDGVTGSGAGALFGIHTTVVSPGFFRAELLTTESAALSFRRPAALARMERAHPSATAPLFARGEALSPLARLTGCGIGPRGPYLPPSLNFESHHLSETEIESLEAVAKEPTGPDGALWPDNTPSLRKLIAWASWALHIAELDPEAQREDADALNFHPDCLLHGDWIVVRRIEADPYAPDGYPWSDDAPTLVKLVAWAEHGHAAGANSPLDSHD